MGTILLFALAAAFYPQLLAVVVVILTRPNPQPLLWACYVGSLLVSVASGIVIFTIFRSSESIVGTSSHRLGPAAYLTVGAIALAVATLVASRRGRDLLDRASPFVRRRRQRDTPRSTAAGKMKAKAEVALGEGSLAVAGIVGALLALPGPFDLLAFGHLARGGYTAIEAVALIVAFVLIKFVLIEVPIVSYAVDPDGTAARVGRFSRWMHANKIATVAAVVAIIGLALIVRGISSLG